MRCSLNLHLRSAHEKPQQPNRFDSPTDPESKYRISIELEGLENYQPNIEGSHGIH